MSNETEEDIDEIGILDIQDLIDILQECYKKKHPMTEATKNFISEKARVVSHVLEVIKVNKSTLNLLCSNEESAEKLVFAVIDVIRRRFKLRKECYPLWEWEKTPENNWVVENFCDVYDIKRDGSTVIIAADELWIDRLRDTYVALRAWLLENSPED